MLGIDERIISEWIQSKRVGRCGLDASGSGQRPVTGFSEYGNESSGSVNVGNFLTE
jgi:hypothetical protein